MYQFIIKLLFLFDAETAHHLGMIGLKLLCRIGLIRLIAPQFTDRPVKVMGLAFPNPVGLAGGFDKNGDYIDALGSLGFGFVELGTVTPRPQPGNPKPRLFRLVPAQAIINRMGFNNKGVDYLIARVKKANYAGIIGINIGKNFDTPLADAVQDYLICFRKAYAIADYFAINISSPNTKNLRDLQEGEALQSLLQALKSEQKKCAADFDRYVPIAVKIAPDLSPAEIKSMAKLIRENEIDAVIATNTTIDRAAVSGLKHANETGGLSGKPLRNQATNILRILTQELNGQIPVIGVGGIFKAADAAEKFHAGASLVQVYSGFIYRGPRLIKEIVESMNN